MLLRAGHAFIAQIVILHANSVALIRGITLLDLAALVGIARHFKYVTRSFIVGSQLLLIHVFRMDGGAVFDR